MGWIDMKPYCYKCGTEYHTDWEAQNFECEKEDNKNER